MDREEHLRDHMDDHKRNYTSRWVIRKYEDMERFAD